MTVFILVTVPAVNITWLQPTHTNPGFCSSNSRLPTASFVFLFYIFLSSSEVHPEHQQGSQSGPTWLMWKQNTEDGEKNVFLRSSASKSSDTNTINEFSTLTSPDDQISHRSRSKFTVPALRALREPGSISLIVWISDPTVWIMCVRAGKYLKYTGQGALRIRTEEHCNCPGGKLDFIH